MRADTASITTPAKPERNLAVTTAIVPVTTAIAQSKKMKIRLGIEKTSQKMKIRLGIEKNVEKKMKIRLGIEKNVEKKTEKKCKKRNNIEFFYDFGFFKNWLKIGHFGGLRLGTTKNEKKRKKKRKKLEVFTCF